YFFFQAEDGIRDGHVTGVQTCALPICFRRLQPEVQFENRMYGTASAIGALFTGAGNLAILGEEINPAASTAFQRAKGYPPTAVQLATGSLAASFVDYAHMIFVHAHNPIG